MERRTLQGLYLPRDDIIGWAVTLAGERHTHENPGPIGPFEVELDAIGCVGGGSLNLLRPVTVPAPWTAEVLIEFLSKRYGWVPVGRAGLPPVKPGLAYEYSVDLMPLEERHLDGYYDGSVVYDTLGLEPAEWTATNRQVVEKALRANPEASVGTDWTGRVLLARPQDGEPALLSRAQFYDWRDTGEVVLPFGTESRWDGGKGWIKGEFLGIPRPPLTPRRAVNADAPEFEEVTRPTGPPVLHQREVIVTGTVYEPFRVVRDAPLNVDTPSARTVEAIAYAHITVLDLQDWYARSALAGQSQEEVERIGKRLGEEQGAYELARTALGDAHPVTVEAARKVAAAGRLLRLARLNTAVQSTYEALAAKLSYGFVAQDLGPGVLTGVMAWVSRVSWDTQVLGNLSGGLGPLLEPLYSPNTLVLTESPLYELESAGGHPWQPSALIIPEQYFRTNMAPNLAAQMDAVWEQSFDPDPVPEGAEPPSVDWDGRWYLHVAAWWQTTDFVTSPPDDGGGIELS